VYGVDRPFFHIDLSDAVDAAVRDARKADERAVLAEKADERSRFPSRRSLSVEEEV
jgi:hypothetical protein